MCQRADEPFRPPDVPSRLPVVRRPDSVRIERDCNRWARPYLVDHFGGPRAERAAGRYLRRRRPLWACLCYPHMLADRSFALSNLVIPSGLVSEVLSGHETGTGLRQSFAAALGAPLGAPPRRSLGEVAGGGLQPPPGFAAGRMLHRALELALPLMAPGVADRCLGAYRALLADDAGRAFAVWGTVMTEYALGIDLTEELAAEPALAHVRDLAVEHLVLVGSGTTVPKCVGALQDVEDRFTETCGEVLGGPLGAHPGIRRYAPELGHLISGNLHFQQVFARYPAVS
ncbi:hypothetical protein [Streptomyces sp. KR80]|uniref:hypothetical protein n=1 Tax=Streptomyces sp. KR80 TaxID=3457426 RepID=UPI003FD3FE09